VDARITTVTEEESEKIAKLAPQADYVFAVWSAADDVAAVPGVKRVIVIRFALDTSLGAKLKLGSMMAAE
jgi:hypothetical protein